MNYKHIDAALLLFSLICLMQVKVSGQQTLFARQTGDWSNGSTWSTTAGGTACGCTPTSLDSVVIQGVDVTLDVNGACKSLNLTTASTLTIANGFGLDLYNGHLMVQAGGVLNHSGFGSNAHVAFESGTCSVNVALGATFETEDLFLANNVNVTLNGAGGITLTDDIRYNGAGSSLTNNLTGKLDLSQPNGSSIVFTPSSSNCIFTNNGTVDIQFYLLIQGANTQVINRGTLNLPTNGSEILLTGGDAAGTVISNEATGTMHVGGRFAVSSNACTFNNAGVFDLDGDLNGWSNSAPSVFNNLSGATFRFAGTGQFFGQFFADHSANTVVFDNASALQNELIDPNDNYWNLTFAGFQKQIKSNLLVKGTLLVQTNAFITNSRSITLENNGAVTIPVGGSLTRTTGFGVLQIGSNQTCTFTVDDPTQGFGWDFIGIGDNATLNIAGAGKIDLLADVVFQGDGSSINNRFAGAFTIQRNLVFATVADNNQFVNEDTIFTQGSIVMQGTANTFENQGLATSTQDLFFSGTDCKLTNIAGATLTCSDDVFFNGSSATRISNQGMLTIANQLNHGGTLDTLMNAGTLTVGAAYRVLANTNDNNVLLNQSGGLFSIAGDMQLNDADYRFENAGTFTLQGRFDDMAGVDTFFNYPGGIINYLGTHNTALNSEMVLYTDAAGSQMNYLRADGATQTVLDPVAGYHDLTLGGTGDKQPINDLLIAGDLVISGSAHLDLQTTNVDLTLAGDWTSTGTFTAGASTVTFNGLGAQQVNGSTSPNFNNWTINKPSGKVNLATNVEVSNVLTLTAGSCALNGQTLRLSNASANALQRGTGYLISEQTDNSGIFERTIGTTLGNFEFPFGLENGSYIPLNVALTNGDVGIVSIATYATESDNLPLPSTPQAVMHLNSVIGGTTNNQANTINRFWQIDKDGPSGTVNLTFTYAESEVTANVVGNETALQAQRYNATSNTWDEPLGGQVADGSNNTIFVPAVDQFSPWTMALSTAPLPVTLLTFEGLAKAEGVELQWTCASETNNAFFTLEKSIDGVHFTALKELAGAGNSQMQTTYQTWDSDLPHPVSYYRLKQTDFDGQTETFNTIAVLQPTESNLDFQVYSNPLTSEAPIKLGINGDLQQAATLHLTNAMGKVMHQQAVVSNQTLFINSENLTNGLYHLVLQNSKDRQVKKLLITR